MIDLKTGKPFPRGMTPTPRHALLAAIPHQVATAAPVQFGIVPKQLSMWGNSTYGCCVTTEEFYALAVWSIMCGLPETFLSEAEAIAWARQNGFLNGANLTDVMDAMAKLGVTSNGKTYKDGPYTGVDYSNETVLQSAISQGPVKIGIDADALPSGAGNQQGWYSIATGRFGNEDHCVGLSGYGTATYLYGLLGVPIPSGLDPNTKGYLLFTWSTIGFVTHDWLMGTCAEAWLRNPTTVGVNPAPTPPTPPTPPNPPSPTGNYGLIDFAKGTVTVPYTPSSPADNAATIALLEQAIGQLGGHRFHATAPAINFTSLIIDVISLASIVPSQFAALLAIVRDIASANFSQAITDLNALAVSFPILAADIARIVADLTAKKLLLEGV